MNLQKITDDEEKLIKKGIVKESFNQTMKFYARYGYDWYVKYISIKGLPQDKYIEIGY